MTEQPTRPTRGDNFTAITMPKAILAIAGADAWIEQITAERDAVNQRAAEWQAEAMRATAALDEAYTALTKAQAERDEARANMSTGIAALQMARDLLEPFCDPELSLGAGENVLPKIDAALAAMKGGAK